ncbi:MAG: L-aspartate oxidase [Rhodothermales bacterium]|nr:L-aspartate oxidase [Rhodothermales bacterium]
MAERYDFLLLGSGIAGLSFALRAAEEGTVAIVTKKESAESNTNYAQGGIAAVIDDADSFEKHIEDTLIAGAGLCDPEIVRIVVTEGPARVRELMEMGAAFTREHGRLHLGKEGGHSENRIVHAADATGKEVERALLARVNAHPNIQVFQHHFALELITDHHLGRHVTRLQPDIGCYGAYVLDEQNNRVLTMLARATLLATGGCGQVYLHSTNPGIATGDGLAMAYRAKARIANMEFIQFHPTSLYHAEANSYLITEAVRGEGGILLNKNGHRFMPDYDRRGELAPRDIVARAIDDQLKQRGDDYVLLDISHIGADRVRRHFPNIYETCLRYGIDMTTEPIPVVPAAHYQCGGVQVDAMGRTSIRGLFACGEVSHTGLHGANRLASNSLLEALVFSYRAAREATAFVRAVGWMEGIPDWDDSGTEEPQEWVLISHNRDELRRVMWDYVGIVRSRLRLERAFRRTHLLYEETEDFYRRSRVSTGLCEMRNMIVVAYLIIRSAQMRRESRGLHFMLDFQETVDWARRPTLV